MTTMTSAQIAERDCTCGEPPNSGHYLWCSGLRGQREYRPAVQSRVSAEELRAAARVDPSLAAQVELAIAGDSRARAAVCDAINARATMTDQISPS